MLVHTLGRDRTSRGGGPQDRLRVWASRVCMTPDNERGRGQAPCNPLGSSHTSPSPPVWTYERGWMEPDLRLTRKCQRDGLAASQSETPMLGVATALLGKGQAGPWCSGQGGA